MTVPKWLTARRAWLALIVLMLLISIAGCIWQSFTTLQQHAIHVGWHSPWVLPVILDALFIATVAAYVRRPDWFTGIVSAGAALATGAGNALAYLYDPASRYLIAPMWIVIATGVVPPLAAFTIAHFIVHERKPRKPRKEAATDGTDAGTGVGEVSGTEGAMGARSDSGSDLPGAMEPSGAKRNGDPSRVQRDRASRVPRRTAGIDGDPGPSHPGRGRGLREARAQRIVTEGWQDKTWTEVRGLLAPFSPDGTCGYVQAGDALKLAREMLAADSNGNATLVE